MSAQIPLPPTGGPSHGSRTGRPATGGGQGDGPAGRHGERTDPGDDLGWALEIRTVLTLRGHTLVQLQVACRDHLITEVGGVVHVFFRSDLVRYVVDREHGVLKRSEPEEARHAGMVGTGPPPRIRVGRERCTVDGYACRRIEVEARIGRALVESEAYYARVPGMERTALHVERVLNAPPGYPAHILEPDELLVASTTRVAAGSMRERQTSRLVGLRPLPVDASDHTRLLRYPRDS